MDNGGLQEEGMTPVKGGNQDRVPSWTRSVSGRGRGMQGSKSQVLIQFCRIRLCPEYLKNCTHVNV